MGKLGRRSSLRGVSMAVSTGGIFFISFRMLSSSGCALAVPLSDDGGAEIWSHGTGRFGLDSLAELRDAAEDEGGLLPEAGPLLSVRTVRDDDELVDDWCWVVGAGVVPLLTSLEGARMAGGRTTRPLGGPWLDGTEHDGGGFDTELDGGGTAAALGLGTASSSRPCSCDELVREADWWWWWPEEPWGGIWDGCLPPALLLATEEEDLYWPFISGGPGCWWGCFLW